MEKLKKWLSNLRWAIFERNPFGKLRLLDKKGQKLYLRTETHFRLTGKHLNIRLESREELEEFCKLYGCKL